MAEDTVTKITPIVSINMNSKRTNCSSCFFFKALAA